MTMTAKDCFAHEFFTQSRPNFWECRIQDPKSRYTTFLFLPWRETTCSTDDRRRTRPIYNRYLNEDLEVSSSYRKTATHPTLGPISKTMATSFDATRVADALVLEASSMSRKHVVSAETGSDVSSVSYTLRGLRDEAEILKWSLFCESVFAYKKPNAPSASYFQRHYFNDTHIVPGKHTSLVRVAIDDETQQIVSSCRIFVRCIGGVAENTEDRVGVWAGGIGEVCTHQQHRRRGLSKQLLQDAIQIMESSSYDDNSRLHVSLLHAAPSFFPVYQSVGYQNTTSQWSRIGKIAASQLERTINKPFILREASFPADIPQLEFLHRRCSEQAYAGCIRRSTQYWERYVSVELGQDRSPPVVLEDDSVPTGKVRAYLTVRPRGTSDDGRPLIQVKEFAWDESIPSISEVLSVLLKQAVSTITHETFDFLIPTNVLQQLECEGGSTMFWRTEDVVAANDLGWMYRPLSDKGKALVARLTSKDAPQTIQHLVWPTDSF